jgi:hypothetical protein
MYTGKHRCLHPVALSKCIWRQRIHVSLNTPPITDLLTRPAHRYLPWRQRDTGKHRLLYPVGHTDADNFLRVRTSQNPKRRDFQSQFLDSSIYTPTHRNIPCSVEFLQCRLQYSSALAHNQVFFIFPPTFCAEVSISCALAHKSLFFFFLIFPPFFF